MASSSVYDIYSNPKLIKEIESKVNTLITRYYPIDASKKDRILFELSAMFPEMLTNKVVYRRIELIVNEAISKYNEEMKKVSSKKRLAEIYDPFSILAHKAELRSSDKRMLWRGKGGHILLFLLYLAEKHRDMCALFTESRKIMVFTEDYSIVWSCDEKKTCKITIPDGLISMIETCTKRFIVIPLVLKQPGLENHINVLIYDRDQNILERFEPHGFTFAEEYNSNLLDVQLETLFKEIINPKMTFKSPENACPFQSFDIATSFGGPTGFCAAWSLYYVDARLSNPDVPPDVLQLYLLDNLRKSTTELSRITDFISDYSNWIILEGMRMIEPFSIENIDLITSRKHLPLESILHSQLVRELKESSKSPIKVITGTMYDIEYLATLINSSETGDIVYDFINATVGDSKTYDDAVQKIQDKIKFAKDSNARSIVFLGNVLFHGENDPYGTYGKDLFKDIDAEKYYYIDKKSAYQLTLASLLGMPASSFKNTNFELLNQLTIPYDDETILMFIRLFAPGADERRFKRRLKSISRDMTSGDLKMHLDTKFNISLKEIPDIDTLIDLGYLPLSEEELRKLFPKQENVGRKRRRIE